MAKYPGILDTPLPRDCTEADLQARYVALFEHYGIARSNDETDHETGRAWMLLALALAINHVPGCRTERRKGKAATRDSIERDAWIYVHLRSAELAGKSVSAAAMHLENGGRVGWTQAAIKTRYYKLCKEDKAARLRLITAIATFIPAEDRKAAGGVIMDLMARSVFGSAFTWPAKKQYH